ncbi:Thioesterase/thiol ester dehydrase-isomerase [Hypoxylon sp. NC0597]|nr:Thioesterase/thiol ester dehydrase-isomerase [Hypoxylon sp. NC0597]
MTPRAPVESHITVVSVPDLGPHVYTNDRPLVSQQGIRSVFGGCLVSQAISAAAATVPAASRVYSSQSSFLSSVDASRKVIYRVERTHDGRVYSTRIVRATQVGSAQDELCVYVAVVSFQNSDIPVGNVLRYGTPMPDLDNVAPDDLKPHDTQRFNQAVVERSVPLLQLNHEDRPFDFRFLGMEMGDDPSQCRIRAFVRSPPVSTDSPSIHLAAFGYMSDEYAYGAALAANPQELGNGMKNFAMGASLTHNISLHDPRARVDEWMVMERDTSWASDGRVLVHQRVWNLRTGKLVMSGTQEALVRLKGAKL